MRRTLQSVLPLVAAGFAWCLATDFVFASPLERSVSASRQFIVYGAQMRLRGSVCDLAEHVKANLLALLQAPDRWSIPILIRLDQPQANLPDIPAVKLNFSQTGSGLKIQLDFLFKPDTEPLSLERELLRAILLEMSYRALPSLPADVPYVSPPEWLVEGLLCIRYEPTSPLADFESPTSRSSRLIDLLVQRPTLLDSQSRRLYRATASALIKLIVQSEDGRSQLMHYITDLPNASSDAVADFQAHFPWFGKTPEQIEQTWTASVKRMASENFILDTFSNTFALLDQLRKTKIAIDSSGKNQLTLEQTVRSARPQINVTAADALAHAFVALAAHAHPLLHSITIDYQRSAEAVARGKIRGLSKRLGKTEVLLDQICSRMREVEDFMNWFEATQARSDSGDFQDYLRAAQFEIAPARRRDPLSVYLDAVELQLP